MSIEWYDMIALRNGGYKSNAVFAVEGLSGEDIFEDRLIGMLPRFDTVLDAGCGHGEFTLRMARYVKNLIGFDNSIELLKIAEALKAQYKPDNVSFVYASTKREMPFEDGQFDLIYDRRGPTSILNHGRILRPGGTVFGIHSAEQELVLRRLKENGFIDIEIEEFDNAIIVFPDEKEFAKYLSAQHGNPDYTLPENRKELEHLLSENTREGRLALKQWRYVWKARRP